MTNKTTSKVFLVDDGPGFWSKWTFPSDITPIYKPSFDWFRDTSKLIKEAASAEQDGCVVYLITDAMLDGDGVRGSRIALQFVGGSSSRRAVVYSVSPEVSKESSESKGIYAFKKRGDNSRDVEHLVNFLRYGKRWGDATYDLFEFVFRCSSYLHTISSAIDDISSGRTIKWEQIFRPCENTGLEKTDQLSVCLLDPLLMHLGNGQIELYSPDSVLQTSEGVFDLLPRTVFPDYNSLLETITPIDPTRSLEKAAAGEAGGHFRLLWELTRAGGATDHLHITTTPKERGEKLKEWLKEEFAEGPNRLKKLSELLTAARNELVVLLNKFEAAQELMTHNFEIRRTHISHNLLRRDFLPRLEVPSEFYERTFEPSKREEYLVESLLGITFNDNVKMAITSWNNMNLSGEMDLLLGELRSLVHFKPTTRLPDESKIKSWIDGIDGFVLGLPSFCRLDEPGRREPSRLFAISARQIVDLVKGLDPNSQEFSRFFQLKS